MSEPPPPYAYAMHMLDGKTGQSPPPAGYLCGHDPLPQPCPQDGSGYSQATPTPPTAPMNPSAPGYPQAVAGSPQGGLSYPQSYPQDGMQYGYPPQPGQAMTVVIQPVQTTTLMPQFRESPVQSVCPYCHAEIVTAVTYEAGLFTWLVAGIVCLFGCVLGCCFIPFCIDACKDVVHHCPSCQQQVARWSRPGGWQESGRRWRAY